jgi:hypothetical protein
MPPKKETKSFSEFIEAIREHVYLYDKSHDDYKDRVKIAETWVALANDHSFESADEAKTKWQYFRREYFRRKKAPASGSKASAKPWEYMEALSFLEAFGDDTTE